MSNVKLVSITQPLVDGLKTPEDLIVYCARVSNPDNQLNTDTGARLIKYCLDHGHFSIFETCHMVVEIETSRAIAAQILRHRSFSFQEFSQRYAETPAEFENVAARKQAEKNRQSSTDLCDFGTQDWWKHAQYLVQLKAQQLYEKALEKGIAREQARMLLPLATKTRLYMAGSVRSWVHYCLLRCQPDTQLEHRVIAEACKQLLAQQLPNVATALGWTT